jgi:hypothetical protein
VDYVAPEQIRGAAVDGAPTCARLRALRVSASGPERESELAVVFAHLNEPPPRPTEPAGLPAAWDRVVARALAKEPGDRYRTCGALADAADAALHGRTDERRRPSRRLVAAAAAAVAVLGAALGTALALRGGGSPPAKPAAQRVVVLAAVDAASGRALADVRSGTKPGWAHAPSDVVGAGGSAWLLLPDTQRLVQSTPGRTRCARRWLPWRPLGQLAVTDGFVWAAQDGGPELARVSVASGRLERERPGEGPASGMARGGGVVGARGRTHRGGGSRQRRRRAPSVRGSGR